MKIKEIATAIKRGGHVYLGLNLPFLVKVVCLVMIIADIVG
jgi:acyl CoA:acetate/3-ketoacid CoA transferase beta subunit